MNILVINPGSTSTKIALFNQFELLWQENVIHNSQELQQLSTIAAQHQIRTTAILDILNSKGLKLSSITAIAARGGLIPNMQSGAYSVNEEMVEVLQNRPISPHAANLAAIIAYNIAKPLNISAYVYDAVSVDEMIDLVRITGIPAIRRRSMGHNLNMRATALRYCKEQNLDYHQQNIIVSHLGGGITSSLHNKGRIIDLISDDEGTFAPERCGAVPAIEFAKYIFDEGFTSLEQLMPYIRGKAGLNALLGSVDTRIIEQSALSGDQQAALVLEAMTLAIARDIAKLATTLNGEIDIIILTGGIAYSGFITEKISQRVKFIAPIAIMAGENEMLALYQGIMRVLEGKELARDYREF